MNSIAKYTCAAICCWIEAPCAVLATNHAWIFGYHMHKLVGEPITGPLSNQSLPLQRVTR